MDNSADKLSLKPNESIIKEGEIENYGPYTVSKLCNSIGSDMAIVRFTNPPYLNDGIVDAKNFKIKMGIVKVTPLKKHIHYKIALESAGFNLQEEFGI